MAKPHGTVARAHVSASPGSPVLCQPRGMAAPRTCHSSTGPSLPPPLSSQAPQPPSVAHRVVPPTESPPPSFPSLPPTPFKMGAAASCAPLFLSPVLSRTRLHEHHPLLPQHLVHRQSLKSPPPPALDFAKDVATISNHGELYPPKLLFMN
jgi:hypothetical protein